MQLMSQMKMRQSRPHLELRSHYNNNGDLMVHPLLQVQWSFVVGKYVGLSNIRLTSLSLGILASPAASSVSA